MTTKEKILDALEKYTSKLRMVVVSKSDVIDSVTSTVTNKPLSANQGRILKTQIDAIDAGMSTVGVYYTDVQMGTVTVSSGNYAPLTTGLTNGEKIISAQAMTWSSPSGPFSIHIYNDGSAYLIASNGFSINDLVVRYYYMDNNYNAIIEQADLVTIPAFAGSAYSNYGGCYYYKQGSQVTVHLGLQGLTANTTFKSQDAATAYYLPEEVRPQYEVVDHGHGGGAQYDAVIIVEPSGNISVRSANTYALVEVTYDLIAQPAS